jgi:hypothetical protein
MNFSPETIKVLQNFAVINPNFVFGNGQTIQTIAEAKNVMASAKIKEDITLEQPIGIYDLKQFLSCLSLVEGYNLEIEDKYVVIKNGKSSIKYFLTDLENLLYPTKEVTLPSEDLSFKFTQADMDRVTKAASVLGHKQLIISNRSGSTMAIVGEAKNTTANTHEFAITAEGPALTGEFDFIFTIPTLTLLPGDYVVTVCSKGVSRFDGKDITYWIGLDKLSTYKAKS